MSIVTRGGAWLSSFFSSLCCARRSCVQCAFKPPKNDPCNVYLEVRTKLEKELEKKNITLEECTGLNPKDMLVFCVVSSRIGTDIKNALEGVDKGASIMMVILHYIIPSQVFGDLADEEALLEDAYHRQLREENRITHFAFHDRYGGLYDHPQNTIGMRKLVDFFHTNRMKNNSLLMEK